jgi:hypothetical protein
MPGNGESTPHPSVQPMVPSAPFLLDLAPGVRRDGRGVGKLGAGPQKTRAQPIFFPIKAADQNTRRLYPLSFIFCAPPSKDGKSDVRIAKVCRGAGGQLF